MPIGRRPILSPPGEENRKWSNLASKDPANTTDILALENFSKSMRWALIPSALNFIFLSDRYSTPTPKLFKISIWFFTSEIKGTLSRMHSSLVSKTAARQAPAAFFDPRTSISPSKCLLPLMTNLSTFGILNLVSTLNYEMPHEKASFRFFRYSTFYILFQFQDTIF